jgi:prevent-host-death family protein
LIAVPKVVNVHEAKTHLSQLLAEVEQGAEIILARGGKPCAKLIAFGPRQPRPLGFARGRFTVPRDFLAPLPEAELQSWEPM